MTAARRLFWGERAARAAFPGSPAAAARARLAVSMLCLCLYVPLIGETQTEFQYFESKGLPAELKSIFKLSVFIPSQEFSTYRQWKQVWSGGGRVNACVVVEGARARAVVRPPPPRNPAEGKECLKCASSFPSCHVAVAGKGLCHVTGMTGFHMTSKEGRITGKIPVGDGKEFFCQGLAGGGGGGCSREVQVREGGHSPATVGPFLRAGGRRGREASVGGLGVGAGRAVPWGGGAFPDFPWQQVGSRNHDILKIGKWLQSLWGAPCLLKGHPDFSVNQISCCPPLLMRSGGVPGMVISIS